MSEANPSRRYPWTPVPTISHHPPSTCPNPRDCPLVPTTAARWAGFATLITDPYALSDQRPPILDPLADPAVTGTGEVSHGQPVGFVFS
ncbi:MAG: hypothetical protein Q9Q40_14440, partial [Acidobacteriota bacterium]|nr:hypothetical protein [Acidobacteriota bacterium]